MMTEGEAVMAVLSGVHPGNVYPAPYLLLGRDLKVAEREWVKVADDMGWAAFGALLQLWFTNERVRK